MHYHHIKLVPIDIETLGKNEDPVLKGDKDKVCGASITTNTVGILIVHPFGLVCMADEEIYNLKKMVHQESKICS